MDLVKESKKEIVSYKEISDDIILKSLILIDFFDMEEDIFSQWNNLLLSRTRNTEFVAPHIHIFTGSDMNTESIEIEKHIISKYDLLVEMINIMLEFKELAQTIVIVTSNELLIYQMKKIEEHFTIIFVRNRSYFINRLNKLIRL